MSDVLIIRWRAVVYYRMNAGQRRVKHMLEELCDLHDLIDLGPHWDTIVKIEVFRVNHITAEGLTVEGAKEI